MLESDYNAQLAKVLLVIQYCSQNNQGAIVTSPGTTGTVKSFSWAATSGNNGIATFIVILRCQ